MKQYYGTKNQERLDNDPEDSVNRYFDYMNIEDIKLYPYPFVVYSFTPAKVNIDEDRILDYVLEGLDEEYSDPDGDYANKTEEMKTATSKFAQSMKQEYTPWLCSLTGEKISYSEVEVFKILGLSK